MTWRPSKSPGECSGINRRDTVSCFVIHKYGNGKQRLLVPADPGASSQVTQSQRVHTKERRTQCCTPNNSRLTDAEAGRHLARGQQALSSQPIVAAGQMVFLPDKRDLL